MITEIKSWLPSQFDVTEEKLSSGEVVYKIRLTLSEAVLISQHTLDNTSTPRHVVCYWGERLAKDLKARTITLYALARKL